jgi:Mn-dependent DtxR family transcriptional regulator
MKAYNPEGLKAPFVGARQLKALRFIAARCERNDPPTRAEIGRHMRISAPSAHLLMNKLADALLIVIEPRKHRGLSLSARGRKLVNKKPLNP